MCQSAVVERRPLAPDSLVPAASGPYIAAVTAEVSATPLQADLIAMLSASRQAERDLFAALPAELRDRPATIGEWSAKDVLAHLGAWRSVEARRIAAARNGEPNPPEDPELGAPVDESNRLLHEDFAGASWEEVELRADESVDALVGEMWISSSVILCDCQDDIVGIGANSTNHATAHLSDIARLAGKMDRYRAYGLEIERVLAGGHLPPRDSSVLLYNMACHFSLADDVDDARRLLRIAFRLRPDLVETATEDPDLTPLRDAIPSLAAAG